MKSSSDVQTVQMQLPSASCGIPTTISRDKTYPGKYNLAMSNNNGYLEQNPSVSLKTNNFQRLDNNVNDNSYSVVQDQNQNYNINISFCAPVAISTNKGSYITSSGYYGRTHNSGYSNSRKNHWKASRIIGNSSYDTDANKQVQVGNTGNGTRGRYNTNIGYNGNVYDNANLNGKTFSNAASLNQNGPNKTKYYSHNRKVQRHPNHCEEINKCAYGLMERFKSNAEFFRLDPAPSMCGISNPTPLDQAIWDLVVSNAQTEEIYLNKLELWQKAYVHIGKLHVRYALFMVGSTMSGLATQNSDIDMCLLLRSTAVDPRNEAVHYLEDLRKSLINSNFVQSVDLIQAKVPILKFVGSENGFTVDLNYNNSVGIRNTHLLSCYVQLDWRVRPLVIVVKLWAQANSINDAKHMTISSYSLALMVIHYLQCGTSPPLLPCLHNMYPDKFKPEKEIQTIEVQEKIAAYDSPNGQSLGDLLIGFLHYFAYFNYDANAISVRLASVVPIEKCRLAISPKNDIHQWKHLCIEEPFDLTNTARSVYDLETFRRIQHVFQESWSILWHTGDINHILKFEENQR